MSKCGREIIHVQVGQCGNKIGHRFLDQINVEHGLSLDGKFEVKKDDPDNRKKLDKIHVYYEESAKLQFTFRAVLVDLRSTNIDVIKSSRTGALYNPDNMCCQGQGAANNWAKGHYCEGAEIIDEAMDIIRRATERCTCPQAFQLTHAIGGGTGSGLGTLLLLKIEDHYPDKIKATYTVYPSPKVSDVVVEPYNAILSIHQLIQYSDESFVIDNEALLNISHNILKRKHPKWSDLNWIISMVMSGVTASLRFTGKLNMDLRKMYNNLVPFPRLNFFLSAYAPLFALDQYGIKLTVQELTEQMWNSRNFVANMKTEDGKYLAACCSYRGPIPTQEIDDELAKMHCRRADDFVGWIPDNIGVSVISVAPPKTGICSTFVANNTAIRGVFQRINSQYAKLFERKAFLHWYKGEGMDEMEFKEADKNIRDLITEYQDKNDAIVDLELDEDEYEHEDEDKDANKDEDEDESEDEDEDKDEDEDEDEDESEDEDEDEDF